MVAAQGRDLKWVTIRYCQCFLFCLFVELFLNQSCPKVPLKFFFLWSENTFFYLFILCKKHNQSFIPGLEFPFSIFTSSKTFEVDKVNAVIKSLSHIGKFVILICRLNCHIGLKALGLKWFGSRIGWESRRKSMLLVILKVLCSKPVWQYDAKQPSLQWEIDQFHVIST